MCAEVYHGALQVPCILTSCAALPAACFKRQPALMTQQGHGPSHVCPIALRSIWECEGQHSRASSRSPLAQSAMRSPLNSSSSVASVARWDSTTPCTGRRCRVRQTLAAPTLPPWHRAKHAPRLQHSTPAETWPWLPPHPHPHTCATSSASMDAPQAAVCWKERSTAASSSGVPSSLATAWKSRCTWKAQQAVAGKSPTSGQAWPAGIPSAAPTWQGVLRAAQ